MAAMHARRRSLSSVLVRETSSSARRPVPASAHWRSIVLGGAGLAAALALWWLAVTLLAGHNAMAAQFAPQRALEALPSLVTEDQLFVHAATSLRRIAVGLAWALVVGVPLGFAIGRLRWLERTLQFLRMISPLSWMPLAVMSLGVGDRAVYFLLAFAAVWPLVMSTASGVAHLDRRWVQLGESLAATRAEMLWHVYVPGIAAHVLTGVRLAIGILWIVLVPAEMLGVSAGLGYLILDTRDRLAYSELTAVILVIGVLGFLLDLAARAVAARLSSDMPGGDR
ncbi:TPA: ABC transporter permease [Burkholderia cepacia]|nr:ABC transporter permease [Burkholderia territorii]HDR9502516.1 ABC transporter permease [Burkholderia cepacia]